MLQLQKPTSFNLTLQHRAYMNKSLLYKFVRKKDGKVLRTFSPNPRVKSGPYLLNKSLEEQLNKLLNLYVGLERKDIVIKPEER